MKHEYLGKNTKYLYISSILHVRIPLNTDIIEGNNNNNNNNNKIYLYRVKTHSDNISGLP